VKHFAAIFAGILLSIPATAIGPAPTPAQAQYEIKFMTGMIDHHQMAIEMAQVCVERAIHEELREMCLNIITTQRQEQQTMQGWLQDWYGINYQPQMNPGMMNQIEQLKRYYSTEFEIKFMQEMIRHHYRAVIEGAHCVERAYHEELIAMCQDIVEAQTAEIKQMRDWLCTWYQLCNWGPKGAVK
jgi:uncharacterized protein (DUF305 family)